MLTIRTGRHIRSARTIKGFRSCPASTGAPIRTHDTRRLLRGALARGIGDTRRQWLAEAWHAHEARLDSPRDR